MTRQPASPPSGPLPGPEEQETFPDLARPDLARPGLEGLDLNWAAHLERGEYRRALAAVRLSEASEALQSALDDLYSIQEAVRARRLPAARTAQARLEALVGELAAAERAGLRAAVNERRLGAALEALEATERERLTDAAALERRLAPALEVQLTRAEALNALGVLHALLDEVQPAAARLAEAVAHDPLHYRAVTNQGNLALEAGDLTAAEALYRQALRINADYAGAHHNLGVALRRQGRLGESVRAIKAGQRLSVRQSRVQQQDELQASPHMRRAVQYVRIGLIVAVVLVVLLLARGVL